MQTNIDNQQDEFMALVEATLGLDYDAIKLKQVRDLQISLRSEQTELYQSYSKKSIDSRMYVANLNNVSDRVFQQCLDVLGANDFEVLFGSEFNEYLWRIDYDTFARHEFIMDRALSIAYQDDPSLTFTADMTEEEIDAKFATIVDKARSSR